MAVVAALLALRPVALQTSLADLVGDGANTIPKSVQTASANLVPILVWAPPVGTDPGAMFIKMNTPAGPVPTPAGPVPSAVRALRATLPADFLEPEAENPLAALASDRYGLASVEDVRRLATPEGRAKIARTALRKFIASPVPPLFPPADDPFALVDGFVRSAMAGRANWTLRDGLLSATDARGQTYFILLLRLRASVTSDTDALIAFRQALDAAIAKTCAAHPGLRIAACGVPLHTAITAGSCRSEINALSLCSVVFIALLAVFAFRSVRWIPLLLASLSVATLAGAAALLLLFREIHLMTIVFGTTVLGLVIDYSFHWLLAQSRQGLVRNLTISCLTTEISLLPLMLSSLPVLRQSAVFLGVALAAALCYVVFGYPEGGPFLTRRNRRLGGAENLSTESRESKVQSPSPTAIPIRLFDHSIVRLFLLALLLSGLFFVRFGTSLTALYRPPAALAEAERTFAELSGSTEADRGFLVFDRAAVAADVAKLYAEQGAKQGQALGLDAAPVPPVPGGSAEASLASVLRPAGELPPGVRFLQPRVVLEATLAQWTREAQVRLGAALVLMLVALVVFCRRRAVEMIMPSLVAIASVAALLGFMGEKVNLFHLLACFLLAGMSIDYTVFLHSSGRAALKPALCSLLTSLVGFGALVFVSFPVVQSFGLVLGVGLPVGFALSLATAHRH